MAEPSRHQKDILDQIIAYLHSRDRSFDELELQAGYCQGITQLWLYAMWLDTQPKTKTEIGDDVERDDIGWFNSAIDTILSWDKNNDVYEIDEETGKKTDKRKDIDAFERFLAHIQFLQHPRHYLPVPKFSFAQVLEDTKTTKGRKLKSEFQIAGSFTQEQVIKLLKDSDLIRDGKLILVASPDHVTGLFKREGNWWYFDSNNPKKIEPIKDDAPTKIAVLIFEAHFFKTSLPSPLAIDIFSFDKDEPDPPYPKHSAVFEKIGYELKPPTSGYAYDFNGLLMATQVGMVDSVNYHLNNGAAPDAICSSGFTALMYAVMQGFIPIVKILLNYGADPNIQDKNGLTAFMIALGKGDKKTTLALLNATKIPFTFEAIIPLAKKIAFEIESSKKLWSLIILSTLFLLSGLGWMIAAVILGFAALATLPAAIIIFFNLLVLFSIPGLIVVVKSYINKKRLLRNLGLTEKKPFELLSDKNRAETKCVEYWRQNAKNIYINNKQLSTAYPKLQDKQDLVKICTEEKLFVSFGNNAGKMQRHFTQFMSALGYLGILPDTISKVARFHDDNFTAKESKLEISAIPADKKIKITQTIVFELLPKEANLQKTMTVIGTLYLSIADDGIPKCFMEDIDFNYSTEFPSDVFGSSQELLVTIAAARLFSAMHQQIIKKEEAAVYIKAHPPTRPVPPLIKGTEEYKQSPSTSAAKTAQKPIVSAPKKAR